jgi:hypothetical protein
MSTDSDFIDTSSLQDKNKIEENLDSFLEELENLGVSQKKASKRLRRAPLDTEPVDQKKSKKKKEVIIEEEIKEDAEPESKGDAESESEEEEKTKKKNKDKIQKKKLVIPSIPSDDETNGKKEEAEVKPIDKSIYDQDDEEEKVEGEVKKKEQLKKVVKETKETSKEPEVQLEEEKDEGVKAVGNFKPFTDGTFYIEGRTCDLIKQKHKVIGIKVFGITLNTILSNAPVKKKGNKKSKKEKNSKENEESTKEVEKEKEKEKNKEGDENGEDSDSESSERSDSKDVNKTNTSSSESLFKKRKRGGSENKSLYEGDYGYYTIFGDDCCELTCFFHLMVLAIKKKESNISESTDFSYQLIKIHKVTPIKDLTVQRMVSIVRNPHQLYFKLEDVKKRFKANKRALINKISQSNKCNGCDVKANIVPLDDDLLSENFLKSEEFAPIFKHAFKTELFFEGLDLLGGRILKGLNEKEVEDITSNREEDTKKVLLKICFIGNIKESTKEAFLITNPEYKDIFSAGAIYLKYTRSLIYGHTCFAENAKERWTDEEIKYLELKASDLKYRVGTFIDSTRKYIQTVDIDERQKKILRVLCKYEEMRLKTGELGNQLRCINFDEDELDETSEYVLYILGKINSTLGPKDKNKKSERVTIITPKARHYLMKKCFEKKCNIQVLEDFMSSCRNIKKSIITEEDYVIKGNGKKEAVVPIDARFSHVIIDRAHLLDLDKMSDLLGYIEEASCISFASLHLMGNLNYTPNGRGCPFKDIYDVHGIRDTNKVGTVLTPYGFPPSKIGDEKIYTDIGELLAFIKRKYPTKFVHYIYKKKGRDETFIAFLKGQLGTLFKDMESENIDNSSFCELIILDLLYANRNDLAVSAVCLQPKGKIFFFGSNENALRNAYNNNWYRRTTLKDILKKGFSDLAKDIQTRGMEYEDGN